jgi:TP901 family phage tail tape measure protein
MASKDGIRVHVYGDYDNKQINKAIKDLESLKKHGDGVGSAMALQNAKIKEFGESMASMGKKMTVGLTLPIVGVGVAATKLFMDFESSMSKITALVGLSTEEVASMRKGVLDLSSQTGKSASELSSALFVVTSAGLRGAAAMDALESSAKAGAAGLGETNDIARAVAGAMNAYGAANLSAAKATDVIVATARAGNFETSQFAGALGQVLPFAKMAGASIEDLGGAVALLTRTNGDAAISVTQVKALLEKMVSPTEETKKGLAAVGLSAADMRKEIAEKGLPAALTMLDKKLGGNREQLGKLLGSSEAQSAAFQILDADAETLAGTFGVTNDAVGMTGDAFDIVADTSSFKLKQSLEGVKNSLIGFGEIIAPFVTRFAEGLTQVSNVFGSLPGPIKNVIVALGALVAAAGPVIFVAGKMMTTYVSASVAMTKSIAFMGATSTSVFAAMRAHTAGTIMQMKVAMIAAQTQAGALAAGIRVLGVAAVTSFKAMALAVKGFILSLGPIGLILTAVTVAMTIFMGKSEDVSGVVSELKGTVDEATGAFTDLSEAMIGRDFRLAFDDKDMTNLREAGVSVNDLTDAVMKGPAAVAALDGQLAGLEGTFGRLAGGLDTLGRAREELVRMGQAADQTRKEVAAQAEANQVAGVTAGAAGDAFAGMGDDALAAAGDAAKLATETRKLSDSFTAMDANIANIRARDAFKELMSSISDDIAKNNRDLSGNSEAARDNRDAILDRLESARDAAIKWGEATGATTVEVETKFSKMADGIKKTAVDKGFKAKDVENLFGKAGVDTATASMTVALNSSLTSMATKMGAHAFKEFKGVGTDIGNGMAQGIADRVSYVSGTVSSAIASAEAAARTAAQSNSPSKLFAEVGKDLARGLAEGVKSESENLKETLRKTFSSWYDDTLSTLRGKVKEAQQVFSDFKAAISGQISSSFNIGAAFDAMTEKQRAADEAKKALDDARASLGEKPEQAALDNVNRLEAAHSAAVARIAATGGTLVGEMNAQAQGITAFSDKMIYLMQMGLDPILWQEINSLGAEKGIAVIDALIAGGVNAITESNALLISVQNTADRVGQLAAENWKGVGVSSAKQTVQGFVERFGPGGKGRDRLNTLMDNLANSMKRETTITVTTINRVVTEAIDGKRAMGGPVAAGKAYLVGERGPEVVVMGQQSGYVVPNHDLAMTGRTAAGASSAGSSSPIYLTVNAGMGTNGAEVGRQVVDAIAAYERRNGRVYVAA